MLKSLAIAATLALTSGVAQAAEVGIRHSAGYQHQTTTHGRQWSSFNGRSTTRSISVDRVGAVGGGGLRTGGGVGAGGSLDVTRNRTSERFRGGSTSNFSGNSGSTFSETSIFAN